VSNGTAEKLTIVVYIKRAFVLDIISARTHQPMRAARLLHRRDSGIRCRPPVEAFKHLLDSKPFFFGSFFVWRAFSVAGTPLSARIYKICTPLSTGIVEKIAVARTTLARKPLRGAVSRGAPAIA
jgi:hypothetical protein